MENNTNESKNIEVLEIDNSIENEKTSNKQTNEVNEQNQKENRNKLDGFSIFLIILAVLQVIGIIYFYNKPVECEPQGPIISTYHGDNNESDNTNEEPNSLSTEEGDHNE